MTPMIALAAMCFAKPVTTDSLLAEMTDLSRLTRRSEFGYKTVEASSYDRASVTTGNEQWFANADAGQFIRVEQHQGREEFVMGEFTGPGAMVRFWSANPMGVARLYFDGEVEPRVIANMVDLLQGKIQQWGDFYSYNAARGTNLYFPFAFAKSLKVTVSRNAPTDPAPSLYYQLNTRLYDVGTPIETYTPKTSWNLPSQSDPRGNELLSKKVTIKGHSTTEIILSASTQSQVENFSITRLSALQDAVIPSFVSPESIMNHIEIRWVFDGQESVRVPLPDYFGAGVMPSTLETMVSSVSGDSEMTSRLPLPFKKSAVLKLVNHNDLPVEFDIELSVKRGVKADYVLHAAWQSDTKQSRPTRDMRLVEFAGEGRYVGTVFHVQNPSSAWWGEGDEKVFVDGEKFPSWFGTGTEDYFGYAWCDPTPFSRPYHGQSRVDGPGNGGQTGNVRWHVIDDIPFKKQIQFDLELWHWADTASRFHTTAFWYAVPGKWTAPVIKESDLEIIAGVMPPVPVEGAIEGEMMALTLTGGSTDVQTYEGLSLAKQLWWKDAAEGDSLTLKFEVEEAGKYKLVGNNCMAVDYGIHEVFVNGKSLGTFDFYSPELKWAVHEYGVADLPKGTAELKIISRGSSPKCNPARRMFALDYILLKPEK